MNPLVETAVHVLDWQPALADLRPTSAAQTHPQGHAAAQDAAVARWAQRCWQDLCTALPQQPHAVLAHPGNVAEPARVYLASAQASGWLHPPLHGNAQPPHWNAASADLLQAAAGQAAARGFCAADCGVLGMMGALTAIDAGSATLPHDFTRQRRHFPLLGAPRATMFATMPRSTFGATAPGHPHALYAVMGDADWVIRCMQLGVKLVQLRLKDATPEVLAAQIGRCAEAAVQHGALLFINDHWQAALRHVRHHNGHGIYGVHLGQEDLQALADADLDAIALSGLRLGLSTHSLWELARALRTRASYLACGPVHATTTKDMPWRPLGNANVGWWAHLAHGEAGPDQSPLPLVAIGGMTPARAQAAATAGADMVAAVSDITTAAQPAQAVAALQQAIAAGHAQGVQAEAPAWPEPTLLPDEYSLSHK